MSRRLNVVIFAQGTGGTVVANGALLKEAGNHQFVILADHALPSRHFCARKGWVAPVARAQMGDRRIR
jgi:hypothetical protein